MILGNKKERFDLETRKPKNLDLQNFPASSKVIAATLQPKRFQIIAKPPPDRQEPKATKPKTLQAGGVL